MPETAVFSYGFIVTENARVFLFAERESLCHIHTFIISNATVAMDCTIIEKEFGVAKFFNNKISPVSRKALFCSPAGVPGGSGEQGRCVLCTKSIIDNCWETESLLDFQAHRQKSVGDMLINRRPCRF